MRENDFDKISPMIDTSDQNIIKWQSELTAIKAISPESDGDGEKEKADYLKSVLKTFSPDEMFDLNAPDDRVSAGYRPNIITKFYGKQRERTLWILSHLDVVPPGELNLWRSDPFKIRVEGDKIYGRGTEDNQQSIVSFLIALMALQKEQIESELSIGFIAVSDEETGSSRGLRYLLEKRRDLFKESDLILVPDSGNKEGTLVEVAEKSVLWLKFYTVGKQTHGSRPDLGVNSFKAASYLVTELDKLHQSFNASDTLYNYPISTFEPTKKEPNVPNVNTIPGEDVFYLDSRILPQYPIADVLQAIDEKVNEIEERFKVTIEVIAQNSMQAPPPTPPNAPVVQALSKAIKETTGRDSKIMGIGGGTVAALFREAGFHTAVWSTWDETAHQPNEYSRISSTKQDAKILVHILLNG